MMRFHYEVIEASFKNKYRLLYTDTDSFVYVVYCDDIYKWVRDNKTNFDNSDDKFNPDNLNKKIIGKFKDELSQRPMKYFLG